MSPWWAKLCVWLGAVLMFVSGGALVGGNMLLGDLSSNVETDDLLGGARKDNQGRALPDGPINMLLVGSDYRKHSTDTLWRADTIILVHIPRERDRAYLISFPRDTMVDIPAHEKSGYQGGQDKINAAFAFGGQNPKGFQMSGGFELLALTVSQTTGVQLDTGAVINFQGFVKVVEALGGVKICIETPPGTKSFTSIHKPYRKFKKGCRHYDGKAVLDYSRQRKQFPDGDYARLRHQQQVIKAIMSQALSKGFDNPTKIPALVDAAGDSLLMDNSIPLEDLAWAMRNIRPENLTAIKVPTGGSQIDGTWYEQMVTEKTDALWKAVNEEKIDDWVLKNQDAVTRM